MNQRDKEKVRKTVQIAKDNFNSRKKISELLFKEVENVLGGVERTEGGQMLDLIFEILYHSYYLDKFKEALPANDIVFAGEYYNIEFINRHLKIILHEYEMITNNLDSIIFEDNDLCE